MRISSSRPTMLAGWLFADLFLVLVLVGMASMPPKTQAAPAPSPSPSAQAKPSPQPSPTRPPGLDPTYIEFSVDLPPQDFRNGAGDLLLSMIQAEVARLDSARRKVGFVLVFASDDSSHIRRGLQTATEVVGLLKVRLPVFATSTGLGLWGGDGSNVFRLIVFFLN